MIFPDHSEIDFISYYILSNVVHFYTYTFLLSTRSKVSNLIDKKLLSVGEEANCVVSPIYEQFRHSYDETKVDYENIHSFIMDTSLE